MPDHRKRRQFKQTDAFTRGMVIGLKRAGWSIRQIAADTHLGASTVHRLWRRWLEQGNVAIYRNVGATRVTSARVDRRILRQAVAAPQATCTAILQHVQDTLDHSISTRTISRRLVANGLHSCRPLRRLLLTPPNRRQRLEWCRARSTWMTEWHRVVFSDESRFCLSSDSRRVRVWRRRGERSNPAAIVERPTVRQRGIMGTMTAQRYVDDVLRPVTLPYLQGVPNALYQQDNARPHTARISQQALQDVQMLPWPPYSPDLSPIEHVWDIIGRRLHALPQPRSEDELWQMVEREWRAIPQDAIRTLIDSLPRRVAACIAVRDIERPGRPSVAATPSTINAVENLILEDRKISIFTIADNLNISYGTVHTIIKEQLQFRKICCKWIPHFLNLDQKLNRIRVSKALLKRYEEECDHFLDQIVTGDESWCYRYDPSTKRASLEWKRGDSPRPKKKIRSQRSAGKVLLTIFWDVDGPIFLHFLFSRQRMNSDLYCDILVNKLKPGIRNKSRGKLSKGVLFLRDNARPHTSCKTVSTIIKLGFEVLEHPAYSPDLAPSDYFLFGLLKKELKGKRFDSDEDVQKVVQDFFTRFLRVPINRVFTSCQNDGDDV
ncbi:hypothetical protein LAZ67_2005981 [Cordylochernes scorpioides]|uniref:Transposase n=1 Tax=Cordylochernes scorpioides TaxID=51811 RepID=A0ABY6K5P2_9ARAC|nr:hypothetical protein LAZ67_2005981 [Cordylochernes scorpioides]